MNDKNSLIVKLAVDKTEISQTLNKTEKNLHAFRHSFHSLFQGLYGILSQFVISMVEFGKKWFQATSRWKLTPPHGRKDTTTFSSAKECGTVLKLQEVMLQAKGALFPCCKAVPPGKFTSGVYQHGWEFSVLRKREDNSRRWMRNPMGNAPWKAPCGLLTIWWQWRGKTLWKWNLRKRMSTFWRGFRPLIQSFPHAKECPIHSKRDC